MTNIEHDLKKLVTDLDRFSQAYSLAGNKHASDQFSYFRHNASEILDQYLLERRGDPRTSEDGRASIMRRSLRAVGILHQCLDVAVIRRICAKLSIVWLAQVTWIQSQSGQSRDFAVVFWDYVLNGCSGDSIMVDHSDAVNPVGTGHLTPIDVVQIQIQPEGSDEWIYLHLDAMAARQGLDSEKAAKA